MAKQIVNKDSIVIPEGTMEDFKRSNHPDFATSSELREQGFSGLRHNSLSDNAEIWLLGEVKAAISREAVRIDPHAIDKAFAEIFALNEVRPNLPELISYKQNLLKKDK